jgi:hypothetical protein
LQGILIALLATSGTLAGLAMTLVGILDLRVASTRAGTAADDMFLFASFGFVVVCFLTFFALRRIHSTRIGYWTNVIDTIFLASLTLLLMAGFVTLYGSFR